MKLNKLFLATLASAIAVPTIVAPITTEAAYTKIFKDVTTANAYYNEIHLMAERKIISGYEDGTFKPTVNITRQHVAALISRALPLVAIRPATTFEDVPTTHPYYADIQRLYRAGIIDGTNGYFRPSESLTRMQMAKILDLAFDLKPTMKHPFKDVSSTHWGAEHVNALYSNGVTVGDKGLFKPDEKVSRQHYAAFLLRALSVKGEVKPTPVPTPTPVPVPIPTPEPTPVPVKELSMGMTLTEYANAVLNDKSGLYNLESGVVVNEFTEVYYANERNRRLMIEGPAIIGKTKLKILDVNGSLNLEQPGWESILPKGYFRSQVGMGYVSKFGGMNIAADFTDQASVDLVIDLFNIAYPEINGAFDDIIRSKSLEAKKVYDAEHHLGKDYMNFSGNGDFHEAAGFTVRIGVSPLMHNIKIEVKENN